MGRKCPNQCSKFPECSPCPNCRTKMPSQNRGNNNKKKKPKTKNQKSNQKHQPEFEIIVHIPDCMAAESFAVTVVFTVALQQQPTTTTTRPNENQILPNPSIFNRATREQLGHGHTHSLSLTHSISDTAATIPISHFPRQVHWAVHQPVNSNWYSALKWFPFNVSCARWPQRERERERRYNKQQQKWEHVGTSIRLGARRATGRRCLHNGRLYGGANPRGPSPGPAAKFRRQVASSTRNQTDPGRNPLIPRSSQRGMRHFLYFLFLLPPPPLTSFLFPPPPPPWPTYTAKF